MSDNNILKVVGTKVSKVVNSIEKSLNKEDKKVYVKVTPKPETETEDTDEIATSKFIYRDDTYFEWEDDIFN